MPELTVFDRGENGPVLYFCADAGEAEGVLARLRELTDRPFRLAAFTVSDWDRELTPWPAPAVFGNRPFGGGAAETLRWLESEAIPRAEPAPASRRYIGGYSLAGLFSLWAFYETALFAGAAGCSGSLWFPGWTEYAEKQPPRPGCLQYLSLGEKEPRTRNQAMARVGECTQRQLALARQQGMNACFTWHPGGHFQEPELRTAKGFAWLLENGTP